MADKNEREADIDRLFVAPLAEFTNLRNALAARLKKGGLQADAAKVKALAKPSISAWAVNQLFFEHRELFERLRVAGERLREAQLSQIAGKPAQVRSALDERRNMLGALTGRALAKLQASGHAATPEATRRISATLEAISVSSPAADMESPGRLTHDMDPPASTRYRHGCPAPLRHRRRPKRFRPRVLPDSLHPRTRQRFVPGNRPQRVCFGKQ